MTQRPTHGGSYLRQKDGSLKLIEGPPESHETMANAEHVKPAPAHPKPRAEK